MRHNRCHAVTKKWKRCGREGDWRLFCDEHKLQWLKAVLIGIIAPVATGMIATWAYSALTATEPALSVKVSGHNVIDQAISQAKMEGTGYNTPSASEVVAKFYVLPTVTPELD